MNQRHSPQSEKHLLDTSSSESLKRELSDDLASPQDRATAFLAVAQQFKLGDLPTEGRHPRTLHLSGMADNDLENAIELLKDIEIEAIGEALVAPQLSALENLKRDIEDTLATEGRIFFCGCGATGRLSLSVEALWRQSSTKNNTLDDADRVRSFIAGGDYALVRSIENFEDHPEYGARQLRDLEFGENDLLVATTEGGETPFVIGATEEAARISQRSPWFLFCNPTDILASLVERSRRVIENPKIKSLSLFSGPMAIAGSTRLQASTILMLSAGAALFAARDGSSVRERVLSFVERLIQTDLASLAPLIRAEANLYKHSRRCVHETNHYAITVLTDTTERSPTFSLTPFENTFDTKAEPAWTYLRIPSAPDVASAWQTILSRSPRALNWPGFAERYGERILSGFSFAGSSSNSLKKSDSEKSQSEESDSEKTLGEKIDDRTPFRIDPEGNFIVLQLENARAEIDRPQDLLEEHLLLKVAMNISSTLVMGRLNRFSGNLMLFVRPTNNKLIDRSIRFVRLLLADIGLDHFSYEEICRCLFEVLNKLPQGEPAVVRTFEALKERARSEGHIRGPGLTRVK